jgi:hypothetical protein
MTIIEIHQKSKKCENINWKTSTPHEHIDHGNTFLQKLTTIGMWFLLVIGHDNEHVEDLFEQHINIEMSQLILTLCTPFGWTPFAEKEKELEEKNLWWKKRLWMANQKIIHGIQWYQFGPWQISK